jgi:hypothetical protein
MKALPPDAVTLNKTYETDSLDDLYVRVTRIPNNNGSLLHAYETEVLIPLSQFIPKPKGKT